jgi:LysR family glycine cleavage system transcriptional activator
VPDTTDTAPAALGDDLAAGRLVAPFGLRCASPAGYQVLSRPERSALPKVHLFKQWLLAYFAQS